MRARRPAAAAALLLLAACAEPPPGPLPPLEPAPVPAEAAPGTGTPPAPPAPVVTKSPTPPAAAASPPEPVREPETLLVQLLAGGRRASVEVAVDGPWAMLDAEGGTILKEGAVSLRCRIGTEVPASSGKDDQRLAKGGRKVIPRQGQGFSVDGRAYAGSLEAWRGLPDGYPVPLVLRNEVGWGDYLAGVLAAELSPESPPESLRALAVLARSFALTHLEGLSDDPGVHQAYRGKPSAAALPALRAAVASTESLRLASPDGSPLPGFWYHSTCGGRTADASLVFGAPPTRAYGGVVCPHCTSSKYYRWEVEVPEEDLRKAIRFGSPVTDLSVARRSPDGRVVAFRAVAAGGTPKEVPALEIRSALGPNRLRSTFIASVEEVPSPSGKRGAAPRAFLFKGRGWGHGVGLCQVGAMAMAREGRTAEEILAFYYPGTRQVRAAR